MEAYIDFNLLKMPEGSAEDLRQKHNIVSKKHVHAVDASSCFSPSSDLSSDAGQLWGYRAVQSASVQMGVVEIVELVLVDGAGDGPVAPIVELGVEVGGGGVVAGPDDPTVEVVLVGVVVEDGTSLLFINPFF